MHASRTPEMMPKLLVTIAIAAGLMAAAQAAAETCLRDPTPTSSAFGKPRPCPTPKVVQPTSGKAKTTSDVVKTTTPDGKTLYVTPDTQVTVSGYVEGTMATKIRK